MGPSTSRNPKGLHGLYRENFTSPYLTYRFPVSSRLVTLYVYTMRYCSSMHIFCSKEQFILIQTIHLRELFLKFIHGWLRQWIETKFRPIASLHSFDAFRFIETQVTLQVLQRCRHFLGGKSLQLHVHVLFTSRQLYFNIWQVRHVFPDSFSIRLKNYNVLAAYFTLVF
jgi:hypothetical protein